MPSGTSTTSIVQLRSAMVSRTTAYCDDERSRVIIEAPRHGVQSEPLAFDWS